MTNEFEKETAKGKEEHLKHRFGLKTFAVKPKLSHLSSCKISNQLQGL